MTTDDFNKEMDAIRDSASELPEAPASATVKVRTVGGYEWLLTTRTVSTNELIQRIELLDAFFASNGWENVSQGYGGKKNEVAKHPDTGKPAGTCDSCGGPMVISKKGKPYCKNLCWKK